MSLVGQGEWILKFCLLCVFFVFFPFEIFSKVCLKWLYCGLFYFFATCFWLTTSTWLAIWAMIIHCNSHYENIYGFVVLFRPIGHFEILRVQRSVRCTWWRNTWSQSATSTKVQILTGIALLKVTGFLIRDLNFRSSNFWSSNFCELASLFFYLAPYKISVKFKTFEVARKKNQTPRRISDCEIFFPIKLTSSTAMNLC